MGTPKYTGIHVHEMGATAISLIFKANNHGKLQALS